MKRTIATLLAACAIAGCVHRVALYSPRREPTDAHRAANSNADCRSCHAATLRSSHAVEDDCMNCHKLCRGC